jgi:hypothetical protein
VFQTGKRIDIIHPPPALLGTSTIAGKIVALNC